VIEISILAALIIRNASLACLDGLSSPEGFDSKATRHGRWGYSRGNLYLVAAGRRNFAPFKIKDLASPILGSLKSRT
jgi:hypothetical protein